MSRALRRVARGVLAFVPVLTAACVEPYDGSKIEMSLNASVHVPGSSGPGAPPDGTHYEMYAVVGGGVFHAINFEIRPIVEQEQICFIEDENAVVPYTDQHVHGLHATKWYDKLFEVYNADGTISDDEAGALVDARTRMTNLSLLEGTIKAIVATHFGPELPGIPPASPQEIEDALAEIETQAPPDLIDEASNKRRAELCREFFARFPYYYVGADRLITLPLNGRFYGVVDGMDPRNGGFIGGVSLSVDLNLENITALRINWQFDDENDPRKASYAPSEIGYHYMAGTPISRTRGVINVPLQNEVHVQISGEAAIFPALHRDEVHF